MNNYFMCLWIFPQASLNDLKIGRRVTCACADNILKNEEKLIE